MSASPKFAHVVFQTSQPEQMRNWYCTVLDAHVVYQDQTLCFITYDDEHHRVAFMRPPVELKRKHPTTASVHHVAYTFDEHRLPLLDRYVLLRDQEITPAVCIAHGVTTSLYSPRIPTADFSRDADRQLRHPRRCHQLHARSTEYADDSSQSGVRSQAHALAARRGGTSVEELIDRAWSLRKAGLPDPMSILVGA